MKADKSAVIIGLGQFMQKDIDPEEALEPVDLMAKTCRMAFEDTEGKDKILDSIDYLAITDTRSWKYINLPKLLSGKLGISPAKQFMTTLGGNMSQWLINQTASAIRREEVGVALLTGGESYYTTRRAGYQGIKLSWSNDDSAYVEKPEQIGSMRIGFDEHEAKYNLHSPINTYPLFENAWRFHQGLSIKAHRRRMGNLLSILSEVSVTNPYARSSHHFTPEEITGVTKENPMVCFPYTKRMCASMDVNKSSTVLMTSVSKAKAMGIPESKWVYWWGGGDADETPWFVSRRPDFYSCPAMKISANRALAEAGISIDEVDIFDLYSCFHIAVQLAREEMGVSDADTRPFSVTGGLPFAGQAGSNCGMESVALMAQRLRMSPGEKGMVTGNGWYLTKQSTGIYSSEPKPQSNTKSALFDDFPTANPVEIVPEGEDVSGTVETYTVTHSRAGMPEHGLIIGRTEDSRRFISHTPDSQELLDGLMKNEAIGLEGKSAFNGKTQIFNFK